MNNNLILMTSTNQNTYKEKEKQNFSSFYTIHHLKISIDFYLVVSKLFS